MAEAESEERAEPKRKIEQKQKIPQKISRSSIKLIRREKKPYSDRVAKSLHYSIIEGSFASAAGNINSSYITPYALALKATNAEIGLLHSLQSLASTVAQIPGAKISAWLGSRKRVWFFSNVIQRLFWIPIIFLPFIAFQNPVFLLILLLAFASFFAALRSPAWSSLMGDLVPKGIWGKYFGFRNMITGIAGLIAILAVGQILVMFGFPMLFSIALLFGFLSIFFFMKMYEPPFKREFHYKPTIAIKPTEWINSIRIHRNFFFFTLYMTAVSFAVNIAAPFFAVYMLKDLNIGYMWYAALIVIEAAVMIASQPYWGRLCDKIGDRKIMVITGVLISLVPFYWLFITSPYHIIIANILSGFAWAGFGVATFNFMLASSPAEKRAEYTANFNFFTGLATVFGALSGGILATAFHSSGIFWLQGLQMVFLISFLLRMLCLIVLPKLKEERIEERGPPLHEIFWRAISINPIRGLIHAIHHPRFSYEEILQPFKNLRDKIKYKLKMIRGE